MKKTLVLLLLVFLLMGSLAACSGEAPPEPTQMPTPAEIPLEGVATPPEDLALAEPREILLRAQQLWEDFIFPGSRILEHSEPEETTWGDQWVNFPRRVLPESDFTSISDVREALLAYWGDDMVGFVIDWLGGYQRDGAGNLYFFPDNLSNDEGHRLGFGRIFHCRAG